jgi:U6 snRNA-associated Sm-like protein LSm1
MSMCFFALRFTANLVLEDTVERIYHQDVFAEQWVGLFLIRGENVVLLGEVVSITKAFLARHYAYARGRHPFRNSSSHYCVLQDLDGEDEVPLKQVEWDLLLPYHKRDTDVKKRREELKAQVLHEQKGFSKEGGEGDGY